MNQHIQPEGEPRRPQVHPPLHPFIKWFSDITIADLTMMAPLL